ncbi:MAG: translation elongation factor Ts [Candidatus Xiphinematobacter sp.]|nr:MAG: translation elongation factor Ts [Candidatus Xiphinematobacter sp.]
MKEVVTARLVKDLRERTGAGIMDCKRALVEVSGNITKAADLLRERGISLAKKRSSYTTREGLVASYIHLQGKVGVLVEINCETDFVANNETFREFVKDITLHIAASHPIYLRRGEVPAHIVENERRVCAVQVQGKPSRVVEKIVEGKLEKFYSMVCLLEQAFVKEPDLTIQELVNQQITKLGENVVIRRFVRYAVGEDLSLENER